MKVLIVTMDGRRHDLARECKGWEAKSFFLALLRWGGEQHR